MSLLCSYFHFRFCLVGSRGGVREQGRFSGESPRLPPMWPEFESDTRRHMWVKFVVGSLLALRGFSLGSLVLSSPQKQPCQIPIQSGMHGHMLKQAPVSVLSAPWIKKSNPSRESVCRSLTLSQILVRCLPLNSLLASLTLALVCRVVQFSAVVAKLIVVREFPPPLLRLYSYLPSDLPCNTTYN